MATLSPTQRTPSRVRVRRPTRPPRSREQRLAEARAREVRAKRQVALAFVRMEQRYELAARSLEQFEAYLSGVRARLQQAGYPGPARRCGRSTLR
jgi:hypothetical protein